jgi:hypothetical protein
LQTDIRNRKSKIKTLIFKSYEIDQPKFFIDPHPVQQHEFVCPTAGTVIGEKLEIHKER